jgi:hypothetical protein
LGILKDRTEMRAFSVRPPWAELIIQGYGVTPEPKLDGDDFGFPVAEVSVPRRKSKKE